VSEQFDVASVKPGELLTVEIGSRGNTYALRLVRTVTNEPNRTDHIYGWTLSNMTIPGLDSVSRTIITRQLSLGDTITITGRIMGAPTFTSGRITAVYHQGNKVL
jgi:hypothetical protein